MLVDIITHSNLVNYKPQVGDVVIWSKMFTVWYGVVSNIFDDEISIIFEGSFGLLVALKKHEMENNTKVFKINELTGKRGLSIIQNKDKSLIVYVR